MTAPIGLKRGETFAEEFRILQELGAATEAHALYAAEQVRTGRPCALRVLHPRFARDADGRARFEAACRVRASIPSDHVVELLAAGVEGGRGAPWFALERLEGETLAALLTRGPLRAAGRTLEITGQLGQALAAVRAAGHAPGRVAPAHVFLATRHHYDGTLTVKLLDFWTADLVRPGDASPETEDVGTLTWQAPEQGGDASAGGPATDVWTLGLLAFQLLAGKPYWKTAARGKPAVLALVREVALGAAEPASARARSLDARGAVPAGFDAWFARCLARDPAARFRDPVEAAAALAAVLDPAAGAGAPRSGRTVARRALRVPAWARSANVLVPAALAVAVAVAVGVRGVARFPRGRARHAAGVAARSPEPAGTSPVVAPPTSAPAPVALDATARASLIAALGAARGSPVWIAATANDPAALTFATELSAAFAQAGWQTHPVTRVGWVVRPGVFVFAAAETPPSYLETVNSALIAAGLAPTYARGYRTYYEEQVHTQPGYQGVAMPPDQTYVVLIGQIH